MPEFQMMRSGFDATRRSRNIGTARQGHGVDNRLAIPSPFREERVWWEQIKAPVITTGDASGVRLQFVMGAVRADSCFVCSTSDICKLLALIPAQDWAGLDTFVFRQSTRKQWLLQPTWGRLAMAADIGEHGRKNIHTGPAILLEALNLSMPMIWSRSLAPADIKELDRLRSDGHTVVEDSRGYTIQSSPEAARATQLFRTIPHEIGHWVDWAERVERPFEQGEEDFAKLADMYWARPRSERESFANRYADDLTKRLRDAGHIPFAQQS